MLTAAIVSFFAGGTFFYGFTIFFNPIRYTFGWTAAVTSVAFVFQRLETGTLGLIAGILVDRLGPRKLMLAGWGLVGLGFILMSRINSLWEFYATFLIIAAGLSFGSFIVTNTAVANWFIKKRSRAITLMYVGFGTSGLLVPLLAWLISRFDWRETLTMVGIGLWILVLPLCLVMRNKPSQYGYLPDGETRVEVPEPVDGPDTQSLGEIGGSGLISPVASFTARAALKTRAFWLLGFAFFCQHFGQSAVMVHIVPYLESEQIPTAIAATAVTGMTLCSLIGRLGFGLLGDFVTKRYLIAIALCLQVVGLSLFSLIGAQTTWLIIPFLLIYAPGYGGPIPLRPAIQADYFGMRSFGTIMGLMSVVSQMAGLISPVLAGWIFDVTGSYDLAWRLFALVVLPGIPLVLLAKPPEVRPESQLYA